MKITHYPNSKCVITVINPVVANDQELECRICYKSDGQLLNVCSCSGSIEYVHIECIEKWINTFPKNHQNHSKCEICKAYKVYFTILHIYGTTTPGFTFITQIKRNSLNSDQHTHMHSLLRAGNMEMF